MTFIQQQPIYSSRHICLAVKWIQLTLHLTTPEISALIEKLNALASLESIPTPSIAVEEIRSVVNELHADNISDDLKMALKNLLDQIAQDRIVFSDLIPKAPVNLKRAREEDAHSVSDEPSLIRSVTHGS